MLIKAFITHKKAEKHSDCQDRFSINLDTKSIAVSDGMSTSIFQRYWAEILVTKFTSHHDWVPNLESVRELCPIWREKVDRILQKQKEEGQWNWRAERNLQEGLSAGATFLGVRFSGNKWTCEVLGDSCLIHIRDVKIEDIFSSEDIARFDNYPDYYDSNPNRQGKGDLKYVTGTLEKNDLLLLVSDPFSDFLLSKRNSPEEGDLIKRLLEIGSHDEFEEVVEEWRNMGMHNDDSTLIVVKPDGSDSFTLGCCDSIEKLIEEEENPTPLNHPEALTPVEERTVVNEATTEPTIPVSSQESSSDGPTLELILSKGDEFKKLIEQKISSSVNSKSKLCGKI